MSKKTRKKSRTKAPGRSKTKPAAKKRLKVKSKASKKNAKKATGKVSNRAPKAVPASKTSSAKARRLHAVPVRKIATLVEGDAAPSFVLPRDGGQPVALANFAGRKLVIFFYPRADTPGCTREAMDFSRLANAFAASQTAILGVSADTLKAQESFRDKHQLTVPLASDETQKMLRAYGAWGEKSMYGKTFQGVLRTTVLVDVQGKIARLWRNVRVDGHADEVLAAARAL